jgi:integrase
MSEQRRSGVAGLQPWQKGTAPAGPGKPRQGGAPVISEKPRPVRGLGRVYARPHTAGRDPVYWIEFWVRGKCHRESSKSSREAIAVRLLKRRLGEIASERFAPGAGRVGFDEMANLVVADYEANGRRSLRGVLNSIKHLRAAFGVTVAADLNCAGLTAYVAERRKQGAAAATIRKELMVVRRSFTLAVRAGLLAQVPAFPPVEVRNARQGFFEADELQAVLAHLAPTYRAVIEFLALSGWRLGEALGLTWKQVDFAAGVVRIEETKNDEPRTLPFRALPELATLLQAQREGTERIQRERGCIVFAVFHHADGRPLTTFHDAWERARDAAGLPGRLIHDLRRTAVRDLERAGVSRSVAMKITGHKTESVYRRYAITCEADLAEGLGKVADYRARAAAERQRRGKSRTIPARFEEPGEAVR